LSELVSPWEAERPWNREKEKNEDFPKKGTHGKKKALMRDESGGPMRKRGK